MKQLSSFKNNLTHQLSLVREVFTRFYLCAFSAILLAAFWLYFIENGDSLNNTGYNAIFRLMVCLSLCIPAFLALHLYTENKKHKTSIIPAGFIMIVSALSFYWKSFETYGRIGIFYPENQSIRYFALFLGAHGLVAISVFRRLADIQGFWQFNKHLLLRTATGLFYSLVLFLGIIAAFAALDALFDFSINEKRYMQTFVIMLVIYNTFFVLGGIRKDLPSYNKEEDYPFSLKIFTQYVLIPLMALYLTILYAYTVKIIILWSLPKGWVSNLVLCFSIAGILAFLLVYPIRDRADNKWVKIFSKAFYIALLPLIILLHISIWTRISDYGITPERYTIGVLSVWLTGITLYFIASKKDNIIAIPYTLALLFIFSCFGPWGFEAVSRDSQRKRLGNILEKNYIKNTSAAGDLSQAGPGDSVKTEIHSISQYLLDQHGPQSLKGLGIKRWDMISDSLIHIKARPYSFTSNLPYLNALQINSSDLNMPGNLYPKYYSLSLKNQEQQFSVRGFDRIYTFNINEAAGSPDTAIRLEDSKLSIHIDDIKTEWEIYKPLTDEIKKCLPPCYGTEQPLILNTVIASGRELRLVITGAEVRETKNDAFKISNVTGYLLF